VAAIVLFRGTSLPHGAELLAGVVAGLGGTAAVIGFFRGMAVGPMSLVAPISATGVAVPVLVGVLDGERPTAIQVAGIAVAFGGVLLAARGSGDAEAVGLRGVHACVWLALLAAVGGGVQLVALDRAAEHDAIVAVLLMRITSVSIFLVVCAVVRPTLVRSTLPTIAAVGVLDTAATVLFAAAATGGLLSVAAVLGCLYPVVTVGLARLRLGERLAGPQRLGVALALSGVVLVSGGG
jgi:drug/metabolite transporter (DMT)-like permease